MDILIYFHIQLTSEFGTEEDDLRLNRFQEEMQAFLADGLRGAYAGDEIGNSEMVITVASNRPVSVLRKAVAILRALGLDQNTQVTFEHEDYSEGISERIAVIDSLAGLQQFIISVRAQTPRTRRRKPKIGDCYAIPLEDGRFGHAQYVNCDSGQGDLLLVLGLISLVPASLQEVRSAKRLFGPIRTNVKACIEAGHWLLVGNLPVLESLEKPVFRGSDSAFLRLRPGPYNDWTLRAFGGEFTFVGKLSEELRDLEVDVYFAPQSIARRIATGENEYSTCC